MAPIKAVLDIKPSPGQPGTLKEHKLKNPPPSTSNSDRFILKLKIAKIVLEIAVQSSQSGSVKKPKLK